MAYSERMIKEMGKAVAQELKRCGWKAENGMYEVENAMRELQRQIGAAGLAEFLEKADDELHEVEKNRDGKKDYYLHSYRSAVIWSVFGKVRYERRYAMCNF